MKCTVIPFSQQFHYFSEYEINQACFVLQIFCTIYYLIIFLYYFRNIVLKSISSKHNKQKNELYIICCFYTKLVVPSPHLFSKIHRIDHKMVDLHILAALHLQMRCIQLNLFNFKRNYKHLTF